MRGQRQRICAQPADINGDLACRLHGVHMQEAACRVHQFCRSSDVLNDARLVIGKLQRQQNALAGRLGHMQSVF